MNNIIVKKKKKGMTENFDEKKIWCAIRKSADRVLLSLSDEECKQVTDLVRLKILGNEVPVSKLHQIVEVSLDEAGFGSVAESYRQYRNYKIDALKIMEAVDKKTLELQYKEDRSNANAVSSLVSTRRSILYGEQQRERYRRIFLTPEELQADQEGYIYIHDQTARLDTFNCSLFDIGNVMKGGFTIFGMKYVEPKSVGTAFSVMIDMISSYSAGCYGGVTVCQLDEIMDPYCQKSYDFYIKQYKEIVLNAGGEFNEEKADKYAEERVRREVSQGAQNAEIYFSTVCSARGDFPFTAFYIGHGTTRWCKLVSEELLKMRMRGQGEEGSRVPVVFPKLVFIYDSNLHGEGKEFEDLFKLAVECSKVAQYPDFLSIDAGYLKEVYDKTGVIVQGMGCRAFLSPIWESGSTTGPVNENDKFVLHRLNCGVVSLNLPMIYMKAKTEGKDFYEVFEYYLQLVRGLSKRTVEYISKLKASCNPLAFMEGGLYGGNLGPEDTIESIIKYATVSFGYGGLSELSVLHNGKEIHEDPTFSLEVMEFFNKKIDEYKKKDHLNFAIYGSPGESWLPKACQQFKEMYGDVLGVTTKGYFSNSFHCPVTADINPIEKMEIESKFFDLSKGGRISHIRVPDITNTKGIIDLIRYGMSLGLYLGVNHNEDHCLTCGEHFIGKDDIPEEEDVCPHCGGNNLVKIRRIN